METVPPALRWLIVGANGMLGQDLVAVATAAGQRVHGIDLPDLDITDNAAVERVFQSGKRLFGDPATNSVAPYDIVVNCAAWTAVDDAEDHEDRAFAVNAVGPANLARACAASGARLVQISTDYVFSGTADQPYRTDSPIAPLSAYGRTKAAGEWAVAANTSDYLLIRTAWLYGAGGPNFPKTMARLAAQRPQLRVVVDQIGPPTWTRDLAELIVRLVLAEAPTGTYHGTAAGATSWADFAAQVVAAVGATAQVVPISSTEFAAKAPRPAYSVLDHADLAAIGVAPIGDWAQRWAVAAPEVLGAAAGAGVSRAAT